MNHYRFNRMRNFIIGLAIVACVGSFAAWQIHLMDATQEKARRADCGGNMRGISLALHILSSSNNGSFASSLLELEGQIGLQWLLCPNADYENIIPTFEGACEATTYYYVTGLNDSTDSDAVHLIENPAIHRNQGANVLYVGGNIEWHETSELWDILTDNGITEDMLNQATNKIIRSKYSRPKQPPLA